jgi:ubiquinone/menaquinone biosynthesis C-methylase UbiE
MKIESIDIYRCPITGNKLIVKNNDKALNSNLESGQLVVEGTGEIYNVINGIPQFIKITEEEKNHYATNLFKEKARDYDTYQHLSFETFYEDEMEVRNGLIDRLNLKSNSSVLEVNAGTGRDSVLIAKRLSKDGNLHVQDLSWDMLEICKSKLADTQVPVEIHQGNACKLPYANKTFDAVYSFGGVGMNTYADNKMAIAELVRVTKVGGKIVFGGLSLAPWLHDTVFGKILINHNPHYANKISFGDIPIEARNLNITWILSGAGFVVDFIVGEGEPIANFNYEIPGPRGGTHNTRYYGKLEGVTPQTKELAIKAREKLGISMHKWLDELIKNEAENILKNKP